ncbi:hypothetical protein [Ornithobacterium rhinotracheale]
MKYRILPLLAASLFANQVSAQNVGINTENPKANLEIINLDGNQGATKSLRYTGTNNNEIFTVLDNGFVGINQPNPKAKLHIVSKNKTSFNFKDYRKTSFYISRFFTGGGYSNSNAGGQLFYFKRTLTPEVKGVYLGPKSDVPAGVYFANNGFTGISLTTTPKSYVEVGGDIRVGSSEMIKAGDQCTENRIAYSKGHFYACTASKWQQIDNN